MATTVAVIAVVVAAAAAAYGAYSASEAQAQQNKMLKKRAEMDAEAEKMAGEARAKQIEYDAEKKRRSFLSRAAGAGVDPSSGSLLETETQFAADTDYAKQLAKYPHVLAGWSDNYKSDLFGFQANQAHKSAALNAGIAGGSTLATRGASAYKPSTGGVGTGSPYEGSS